MHSIPAEDLARLVHASGKRAVENGKVLNNNSKPWIEYDDLPEHVKAGRRMQALDLMDMLSDCGYRISG